MRRGLSPDFLLRWHTATIIPFPLPTPPPRQKKCPAKQRTTRGSRRRLEEGCARWGPGRGVGGGWLAGVKNRAAHSQALPQAPTLTLAAEGPVSGADRSARPSSARAPAARCPPHPGRRAGREPGSGGGGGGDSGSARLGLQRAQCRRRSPRLHRQGEKPGWVLGSRAGPSPPRRPARAAHAPRRRRQAAAAATRGPPSPRAPRARPESCGWMRARVAEGSRGGRPGRPGTPPDCGRRDRLAESDSRRPLPPPAPATAPSLPPLTSPPSPPLPSLGPARSLARSSPLSPL